MANVSYRRGFQNPRLITGGEPATFTYAVSSTYAATFYNGDPVTIRADGFAAHKSNATTLASLGTLYGICNSFLGKTPGTNNRGIQVITDLVNTTWEIQLSTSDAGQDRVGDLVKWVGAGGVGRPSIYQSTVAVTGIAANNPCRIIGYQKDPKNETNSANPVVVIRFEMNQATD